MVWLCGICFSSVVRVKESHEVYKIYGIDVFSLYFFFLLIYFNLFLASVFFAVNIFFSPSDVLMYA